MLRHEGVECTTPLGGGPLPICSRAIETAYTGPQRCVAGRDVRHKAISGVPLRGQLGSRICMLILGNIRMCWGPPELEVNACRLKGAHCLPGPVGQGPNTLRALERLESRLGVTDNDDAPEVAQG